VQEAGDAREQVVRPCNLREVRERVCTVCLLNVRHVVAPRGEKLGIRSDCENGVTGQVAKELSGGLRIPAELSAGRCRDGDGGAGAAVSPG
jgi:hypothetical protein